MKILLLPEIFFKVRFDNIMIYRRYEGYEKYNDISGPYDIRTKKAYAIKNEGEKQKSQVNLSVEKNRKEIEESNLENCTKKENIVSVLGVIGILGVATVLISYNGIDDLGPCVFVILILIFIVLCIRSAVATSEGKKQDSVIASVEEDRKNKIKKINETTEIRLQNEIALYDKSVKETFDKIISDPSNIDTMVDYSIEMFKRMISHADSDSNKRFIECNFTYVVTLNEIKYLYDSEYTNPRDDFNFEKQRYRNLHCDYEREGLALALAQIVSKSMKDLYPPNTISITIKNVDYKVTMAFKAPNEKFVVARDIV